MGIKASATCVMNFDERRGLAGRPAAQGHARHVHHDERRAARRRRAGARPRRDRLSERASPMRATRLQGRALTGRQVRRTSRPIPIIVHPDVRRMLLTMQAHAPRAAARSRAWIGAAARHRRRSIPTPSGAQAADDLVALMTPIVKAFFTDLGFDARQSRRADLRRPRLYPRERHGAVRARRPHHPDLRRHQRHPGARPGRPQARRAWHRPLAAPLLPSGRRLHRGAAGDEPRYGGIRPAAGQGLRPAAAGDGPRSPSAA